MKALLSKEEKVLVKAYVKLWKANGWKMDVYETEYHISRIIGNMTLERCTAVEDLLRKTAKELEYFDIY